MAGAVTVALLGAHDVATELGKKGTQSDITLFNAVRDGHAATIVEPTQFPEKFPPLLYAIGMADRGILVLNELNKEVAETVATLDLVDLPVDVVRGGSVGEEELRRAFKGTRLERVPFSPTDLPKLRDEIDGWNAEPREGSTLARIDHAFPVKGVGAVALGVVRQGTLRAHDRLRLYPTDKLVEVRSVQVHDVDVPQAETGERVGVALKGVDAGELSRGQVLAPDGALQVGTTLAGSATTVSRYYRGRLMEGNQVQLAVGLQVVPAQVTKFSGMDVRLETDRPIALAAGDPGVIADLSVPAGPRVVARTTLKLG